MRVENTDLIAIGKIGTNLGASLSSSAILVEHVGMFSLTLAWSGAINGDFSIQCSNDVTSKAADVVNWDTISSSVAVVAAGLISGDAHLTYNINNTPFRWFRIVYTRTSAAGTLTVANLYTKGF
jgi:hypothetical protein